MNLIQNDANPGQTGVLPVGSAVSFGVSPGGLPQTRIGWGTLPPGAPGSVLTMSPADPQGLGGLLSGGNGTGLQWALDSSAVAVWQVGGAMTAVNTTAALTSLLGSGSANQLGPWITSGAESGITIPAYFMNTPGSTVQVNLVGSWGSTNLQPTILFTVTLGGVTILTGTATAISAAQTTTGGLWAMNFTLTTVTSGASGTVAGAASPATGISFGTGTPGFSVPLVGGPSAAIALSSAAVLGVNVQWGTSSASNTIVVSAGQACFMPGPTL